MGVPGLARRLEPYTTRYSSQDLVDYVAIIDGPSLAYHAHKLALVNSSNQLRIPSYTEVNNEAISWLNSLEQQGFKVAQIFFDGALPEAKRPERLARTEQNNRKVHQLRSNYPTPSCPVPTYLGSTSYAFLAPALREALNDSPYSTRVSIVPGEADDFCALHARPLPRSVIFTSDTDLLLYDYQPETLIVFHQDADLPTGLKAFSPHQTKQKLQLQSLVQFAYVVQQRTSESQEDLIKNARAISEVSTAAYADFSKRYVAKDVASPHIHVDLKGVAHHMDVRTSEFVYQALDSKIDVQVYLPLLVEDPNQASAWNICQDIRAIAYSLLASQTKCVLEYKRKAQGISPQELFPLQQTSLEQTTKDLVTRIASFKLWAESKDCRPTMLWALFALGLVVPELNTPPSLSLVVRVLNGDFDNTWAFVQLTARLQAAIYSLRMLKHISSAYLVTQHSSSDMALYKNVTKIEEQLWSFPSIANSIIVPGQVKQVLVDHNTLTSLIEEIYTSLGVEIPDDQTSNKKKKRQAREADRKKRKADQRQQNQSQGTTNVFALLNRT